MHAAHSWEFFTNLCKLFLHRLNISFMKIRSQETHTAVNIKTNTTLKNKNTQYFETFFTQLSVNEISTRIWLHNGSSEEIKIWFHLKTIIESHNVCNVDPKQYSIGNQQNEKRIQNYLNFSYLVIQLLLIETCQKQPCFLT